MKNIKTLLIVILFAINGLFAQTHFEQDAYFSNLNSFQFFNKDRSVSLDYREELSDGSVIGKVRYGQRVFDLRYKNENLFSLFDKPVHLNLGYAEGVNLRGVKSLIFTSDITKNSEVTLKYIDNIGKGPIGSTNLAQNRNFLVSEIGFKF